jgi:hypothetical protein
MMNQIETVSTSLRTAECNPVPLRESDHVRLVFVPTLVKNESTPEACVRGHFIYQRKRKNEQWASIATIPLSSLKSGEGFKLELHSQELLTLVREVGSLYRLYRQQGIPRGRSTFVRLEAGLARLLSLNEDEMAAFFELHSQNASTTLLKLWKWFASSPHRDEAAAKLAAMPPEELPSLNAVLGLAALKGALSFWREKETNNDEDFWHRALADRSYVLSQVFAYPIVVIHSKAYVGGKQMDNRGGNIVDFLAKVESTDAVILIEIKTPGTKLLGPRYRDGVFPLSTDLSGAVAQVLRYRQSLMSDFNKLTQSSQNSLTMGEPRCLVIAGQAGRELTNRAMRENFELLRERLQGVTIVTYDELFRRLQRHMDILGESR